MTAVSTAVRVEPPTPATATGAAKKVITSRWASAIAIVLAVLWTTPTFGLLVTSFRRPEDILKNGWWNAITNPRFTLENYNEVIFGGSRFIDFFVNSIIITIPAVLIPVAIASLAAYAFAWTKFKGRDALFIAVFALQVVPLQVALIPLLTIYVENFKLANTFWSVWLSHSIFALPFAIFLLHNFMKEIPEELVEAARMDGASHATIFFRVLMPLIKPAIAAFAIFQFLWVWNDLLVSLTFLGGTPDVAPLTVRVAELAGTRGGAWYLLSAGAFVSIIVPVAVFLALQRFFVRGLLAGGLKG